MRASADRKHREWGPASPFMRERMAGVLAAIAWLRGEGPAPASGERLDGANPSHVRAEWLAARDLEHRLRGTPDSWRPGGVAQTLAWFMCDPTVPAPA